MRDFLIYSKCHVFRAFYHVIKSWSDNISLSTKRDAKVGSDYDAVNDDGYGYVD
jgi:hypothetical protein